MSYLERLFHATEEENRRVLLSMLDGVRAARFLDVGCGDGELTIRALDRLAPAEAYGVELEPGQAARARARGVRVVVADLNRGLPFEDGAFDAIVANQVIEHLWNTDRLAEELARVLSPRGVAVLSTNNLASLHAIVSLAFGQQPPAAHVSGRFIVGNALDPAAGRPVAHPGMAHLRLFAWGALRPFLRRHGLESDVYRSVGFYPAPVPAARVLTRVLPWYGAFLTCRLRRAA